ncbi:MAG: hypothetical protein ABEJ95_01985 [Candidatus Nanohalobium sp.]
MNTRKQVTLLLAAVVMAFTVSAVTFGADAQPVIQSIAVHDVTSFDSVNRTNKTNLVDSITPGSQDDMLNISSLEPGQQFRYDFRIENEGDTEWNISQDDELFHNGIDTDNWTINTSEGAWYRIKGGEKRWGC